jgi:hypothetical protein
MEDSLVRELLIEGVAAAKANEEDAARRYLERLLRANPPIEDCMEAWYWLSQVSTNPSEKRDFLETLLANNPADMRARRALAILDGKLNPAEIVDPDKLPAQALKDSVQGGVDRFTCHKCGGRMVFTPDGQRLTCEYCNAHRTMAGDDEKNIGFVPENNFLVALATGKGHRTPVQMRAFCCQGCGISFILAPAQTSMACPYCDSVYVIEQVETREMIAPDGVIPFKMDKDQANRRLTEWIHEHGAIDPQKIFQVYGIYLPAWVFNMTGIIPWNCEKYVDKGWIPESGEGLVLHQNRISACQHHHAEMQALLESYDLKELVLYDPGYLADWLAETYQVTAAQAALDARKMTLDAEKPAINRNFLTQIRNMVLDSTKMVVESYQLVLLPVWINRVQWEDKSYEVLINGQTGEVLGEHPCIGLLGWLRQLF